MKVYLLIALSLVFFAISETFSKLWANEPRWWLAVLVVVFYGLIALTWLPALRAHNNISTLGTIWNMGAVLLTVLIGAAFQEEVSTRQWIGIALAFVVCFLVS
jgi:drug/metabolite transporter (DMT)-like permease